MKYFKQILFILLGLVLLTAIVAGGYAVWFFNLKAKEVKRLAEISKPTIILPAEKLCDIPSDAKIQTFSFSLRSPDVEKTKNRVNRIIDQYNGKVKSVSDYISDYTGQPETELPPLRTITFTATVSLDKAEAFIKDIRKLGYLPNSVESESIYTDDAVVLSQRCKDNLERIKELQAREILYLDQLKKLEGKEVGEIIIQLGQIRSETLYYKGNIDYDSQRLNTLEVTITISEVK